MWGRDLVLAPVSSCSACDGTGWVHPEPHVEVPCECRYRVMEAA